MSYALNMIIDINCVHIEYNGENGNLHLKSLKPGWIKFLC